MQFVMRYDVEMCFDFGKKIVREWMPGVRFWTDEVCFLWVSFFFYGNQEFRFNFTSYYLKWL